MKNLKRYDCIFCPSHKIHRSNRTVARSFVLDCFKNFNVSIFEYILYYFAIICVLFYFYSAVEMF